MLLELGECVGVAVKSEAPLDFIPDAGLRVDINLVSCSRHVVKSKVELSSLLIRPFNVS